MTIAPAPTIRRMWINQPSTLQALHHLHGVRVLAGADTDVCDRIFFLSGETISMQAPRSALSEGWPATSRAEHDGVIAPRRA